MYCFIHFARKYKLCSKKTNSGLRQTVRGHIQTSNGARQSVDGRIQAVDGLSRTYIQAGQAVVGDNQTVDGCIRKNNLARDQTMNPLKKSLLQLKQTMMLLKQTLVVRYKQ